MNAPDTHDLAIAAAYDETPYQSNAFAHSAPGNLRAVAHLHGIDAPKLATARVLELGCAAGGNLMPFAAAHPQADVVGVDLSPVQINAGQRIAEAAGLANLRLLAMSLTDIDESFGKFDYIIVHGVYSWVPPEVRDAMLRVCKENLSEAGLVYISYNTYPGWKAYDIMRDAMLLASHDAESAEDALAKAKTMLELFESGGSPANSLYAPMKEVAAKLRDQSDYYLAHEYLERFNSPCYFVEFAAAVNTAGLTYVGDAQPVMDIAACHGVETHLTNSLLSLGKPRELRLQYLDLAAGRTFRTSILAHASRSNDIAPDAARTRLAGLHFAASIARRPDEDGATSNEIIRLHSPANGNISLPAEPLMAEVTAQLEAAWPRALGFDEIVSVIEAGGAARQDTHAIVIERLWRLMELGCLQMRREPSSHGNSLRTRPCLIPGFAQLNLEAREGISPVGVYNFWHRGGTAATESSAKYVVSLLDGRHTAAELGALLRDALKSGTVTLNGQSKANQRNLDALAQSRVREILATLQRAALLA